MSGFDRLRFEDDLEESPRIKGSRVSVIQLYEMHVLKGLTVEKLAELFPGIGKEDVVQAIEYAVSHPDMVREQATSELTKDVVERQGRSQAEA